MTNEETSPAPSGARSARLRRTLAQLLRTGFLLVLPGLVATITVMPVITLGPIAFAIRQDFPLSLSQIGFAYTVYFLASALLTSVGGWLIGKFSTLAVVRSGLACSVVLSAVLAAATSGGFLLVVAGIAGAVNGLMTPSINVLITRMVPVGMRGLAFGIKVASAPGAAALAALGGWATANFGLPWQGLYWTCAAVGLLVICFTIPLGPSEGRVTVEPARVKSDQQKKSRRSLIFLAVGGFLGATGTAVLPPFLVDSLIERQLAPGTAASLLAVGSCLGFFSRILVGGLSDRWPNPLSHLKAVTSMMMVAALSMFALAFGQGQTILVVGTLGAFLIGWAWPGLIHYAVIATHPATPALATTYMQSGTFLGAVAGPSGFGLLAEHVSFSVAWAVSATAVVASAALLSAGVWSLQHEGRR